jgi:hypothetical protein
MQSMSGNDQLVADVFVILCTPSCLGAGSAQNDERRFLFFRTASRAFAAHTLHVVGSCIYRSILLRQITDPAKIGYETARRVTDI